MKINHIDDADLKTLRNITHRLYNDDGKHPNFDERREMAYLMWLILGRIETAEVELKEHQDG